jgi:hypothetical protein
MVPKFFKGLAIIVFSLIAMGAFFHPGNASVNCCPTWTGASFKGFDDFYGTTVAAFRTGRNATVAFTVANDGIGTDTVNAVKIRMDWGVNITASGTPATLTQFQTKVFYVSFQVPATTTASNIVTHSYQIIAEHTNGPAWTLSSSSFGSAFAVYSAEQDDAQSLRQTYQSWSGSFGAFGVLPYPLGDSRTRALVIQAQTENSIAERNYSSGNFTGAKQHWQNAVGNANAAVTSMQTQGSKFEDAVNSYITSAYLGKIGPVLAGIGWLIIGLGVLIYARKRPAPPAAPPATPRTGQ